MERRNDETNLPPDFATALSRNAEAHFQLRLANAAIVSTVFIIMILLLRHALEDMQMINYELHGNIIYCFSAFFKEDGMFTMQDFSVKVPQDY